MTLATSQGQEGHREINSSKRKEFKKAAEAGPGTIKWAPGGGIKWSKAKAAQGEDS